MSTVPDQKPTSSNQYIESLLWGGWYWHDPALAPGDPVVIRYFIDDSGARSWTAEEHAAVAEAYESWSDVANITFVEVFSEASADMIERLTNNRNLPGGLGVHGTVEDAAGTGSFDGNLFLGGDGQNYGYYNHQAFSSGGHVRGGYDFVTFVHEIGHGLGLAHPHDDGGGSSTFPGVPLYKSGSFGSNKLNQGIFTTMSYNDGWASEQRPFDKGLTTYGYQSGPMAFDIAAIQYLYGANTTFASGDDVYVLPDSNAEGTFWSCIWDTGGTDSIVYNGIRDVIIDLTPATLDNSPTGGGVPTYARGIFGGFTIANGVEIENAQAGDGDDLIVANALANELDGGLGNDTLSYVRSDAGVSVSLVTGLASGGYGDGDVLVVDGSFSSFENLMGSDFEDGLTGDDRSNFIFAGAGDDTVDGGLGDDFLIAGTNDAAGDTISFATATAGVLVNLGINSRQDTLGAGKDVIRGFENWEGSSHSDLVVGTRGANTLLGAGGSDNISGKGGADALEGGDADDTLIGGGGGDSLDGGDGSDLLNGGGGSDTLTGGSLSDSFYFTTALGAGNIDVITDFTVGEDLIVLENAIFVRIGAPGSLDPSFFGLLAPATPSERIIYDDTTGALFYDGNGSGAGGRIQFAWLDIGLALGASDFYVI